MKVSAKAQSLIVQAESYIKYELDICDNNKLLAACVCYSKAIIEILETQ
jgi:hypothetical protein